MNRQNLLKRLALLVFFIFVANFLANKFHWYYSIWYFDMIMHFIGGFWAGLLVLYFLGTEDFSPQALSKIFFLVLVIGIGWEVFELFVDKTITSKPFNLFDTSSDLLFDLSGAMMALFYYLKKVLPQKAQ